jgi:hypothetical protein
MRAPIGQRKFTDNQPELKELNASATGQLSAVK